MRGEASSARELPSCRIRRTIPPGSEPELERLQLAGPLFWKALTRRLIRESGIRAGMRVLDLGSGPGDVAFLVAEAVGPHRGSVARRRPGGALESLSRGGVRRRPDTRNVAFAVAGDDSCPPTRPSMRRSGGSS